MRRCKALSLQGLLGLIWGREGPCLPANLGARCRTCADLFKAGNNEWQAGKGLPFGLDLKGPACFVAREHQDADIAARGRRAFEPFQDQRDPQIRPSRPWMYCLRLCV